jgi:hypothetical protein
VTPGFAKPRSDLPWLPYEEQDRVIINAHNFTSPAWTPAQITTYLWLDAADTSTIYDASSGGSLTADGGSVGRLEDKSGNSRHATQSVSANRPLRSGSTILFAAKSLNIPVAALASLSTGRCIVGVYNSSGTSSSASVGFLNIESGIFENPQLRFGIAASGNQLAFYWAGVYAILSTVGVATSKVHATTFGTGIAVQSYENGSSVASGTRSGTWSALTEFTAGASVRFAGTRNGTLQELIVCRNSDRQITEGYLAWKWSLQGSLDASHPYKSVAP